jgi:hypothetical protein
VSTTIFRRVYICVEHLLKSVYAYKNTRTTALIFVKSAQHRVECPALDLNAIWAGELSHTVLKTFSNDHKKYVNNIFGQVTSEACTHCAQVLKSVPNCV